MVLTKKKNNKGADQTARMCRLVCACVVRNPPPPPPPEDRVFLRRGPFYTCHSVVYCNGFNELLFLLITQLLIRLIRIVSRVLDPSSPHKVMHTNSSNIIL